jgi:deoxyribodipyrimidine photo-lyase
LKSLYWVRSDLRIEDNSLFVDFLSRGSEKLVVILPDKSLLQRSKLHRQSFAISQMVLFKKKLERLGLNVVILWGDHVAVLKEIQMLWSFDEVFYARSLGTEEAEDERFIRQQFLSVRFTTKDPSNLLDRDTLDRALRSAPKTFTQFRKLVEESLPRFFPVQSQTNENIRFLTSSSTLSSSVQKLEKMFPIPSYGALERWAGDGMDRVRYLTTETKKLLTYADTRNGMIEFDHSSKLSPWLSIGSITAPMIWNEVSKLEDLAGVSQSTTGFKYELLWREYFRYLFCEQGGHFFSKEQKLVASKDQQIHLFDEWKQGKTGSAFVNANMQELCRTGWMSNRGRQNVASFLAKELKVDWRMGASYFEECLIDYDPFNNWGNWGYLAGVGTDPRDRKFNPELQAKMYDPDGAYQKLWL